MTVSNLNNLVFGFDAINLHKGVPQKLFYPVGKVI